MNRIKKPATDWSKRIGHGRHCSHAVRPFVLSPPSGSLSLRLVTNTLVLLPGRPGLWSLAVAGRPSVRPSVRPYHTPRFTTVMRRTRSQPPSLFNMRIVFEFPLLSELGRSGNACITALAPSPIFHRCFDGEKFAPPNCFMEMSLPWMPLSPFVRLAAPHFASGENLLRKVIYWREAREKYAQREPNTVRCSRACQPRLKFSAFISSQIPSPPSERASESALRKSTRTTRAAQPLPVLLPQPPPPQATRQPMHTHTREEA